MRRRTNREINVFNVSFLDVLANTIGGLAFLLILAVMMAGVVADVPAPPVLPLRVRTQSLPDAHAGERYELALAAEGGHPPYRWELRPPAPGGLALAPDGELAGTPAAPGELGLALVVTDGRQQEAAARLALRVRTAQGRRPLRITTRSLPLCLAGEPVRIGLACEGGLGPYAWTARGLPGGVSVEDGQLVGAPAEAGRFEVELTVADGADQSSRVSLPLSVERKAALWLTVFLAVLLAGAVAALAVLAVLLARARGRSRTLPLRITTESVPNARASGDYAVQLACEGGRPPYRWRVADGELPPGLDLTAEGKLHGRPFEGISVAETKEVPFTVEVRDEEGQAARQSL